MPDDPSERFREGLERILARSDALKQTAGRVWRRLRCKPGARTIALPSSSSFADHQDLFLNCARMRGDGQVLLLDGLRKRLGEDFPAWMRALQRAGGFQPQAAVPPQEDRIGRLRFRMPGVDWEEFRPEITRNTDPRVLEDAWKTARYLSGEHPDIAPAALGARLFRDSKRLKNRTVLGWTCRLLRQLEGIEDDYSARELLERFGLAENPTASLVAVFGPFRYVEAGRARDWIEGLWQAGQSAVLSCDNLAELQQVRVDRPVLTIENETVFNLLKDDPGDFALVYTAGFPGRAVRRWLGALPPETPLLHWGDGDPEGYEIAARIHAIHPLRLFRCDAPSLERLKDRARDLPPAKLKRARRLSLDPGFPFHPEIDWILRNRRWIEQEAFFSERTDDQPRPGEEPWGDDPS